MWGVASHLLSVFLREWVGGGGGIKVGIGLG